MKKLISLMFSFFVLLCADRLQAFHAKTLFKCLTTPIAQITNQTRNFSSIDDNLADLINLIYGSNDARIDSVKHIIDLTPQEPLQIPFFMDDKTIAIIADQVKEWKHLQKMTRPGSKDDRNLAALINQYTERMNPESYFKFKTTEAE